MHPFKFWFSPNICLGVELLDHMVALFLGFPGGSEVKASASNTGDLGSIPGLGRSPGEGNGTPLQYSCLENPMDGGAWWATVHGVAKSQTRLSDLTYGTSIVAVPIYIPTNGVGGFLSFHALSSTYCL